MGATEATGEMGEAGETRVRCKQGWLVVTASEVQVELPTLLGLVGIGQKVARRQSLRRDSITRIDTEAGARGVGAWVNLIIHGQTPDALLRADLVNARDAEKLVTLLHAQ